MFMDSPRANPPPYYSHGDNLKRFWCKYSMKNSHLSFDNRQI